MTTVDTAVGRSLRHLHGQARPVYDVLATTLDASTTAVVLTHNFASIGPGDYIEVEYEQMLVLAKSVSTLTVLRGVDSTAAAHTAGALIAMKPRYGRQELLDLLHDEIISLPTSIFGLTTQDVTFGTTASYIELSTTKDVIDVVQAWRDPASSYDTLRRVPIKLVRDLDLVASGYALQVATKPGFFSDATTVRVTFSHRFDTSTFTSATDLETTVGISEEIVKAIEFGAAYRAILSRTVARSETDAQPASRLAKDVPASFIGQVAESFRRARAQLVRTEISRLRRLTKVTME